MDIYEMLKKLADEEGSDLYLSAGAPPSAKFSGELTQIQDDPYTPDDIRAIAYEIMNEEQQKEFEQTLEMNLAISPEGIGRFRVNIFIQRNAISMVCRNIQTEIPKFDDLGLPEILKDVVEAKNGLVLFVGGTGSGKSTSLAALIDHRNAFKGGHIITIEDPVEYVHSHKKCIVNQREVGVDTLSFHDALKNTLRQAPDVILIGEIRDRETMEHCLAFAETGHLAISTLHANNANQALDRIINFFPEERRKQLLADIGNNVRAIVSQRLVPTVDGKRCAAIEILLGSHTIKQMIMKGQLDDIKETMQKSENLGMKTFDGALFDLVVAGRITTEEAIKNADSANNLRLKLKLSGQVEEEESDDPAALLLRGGPAKEEVTEEETASSEESESDSDDDDLFANVTLDGVDDGSEADDSLEALLANGVPTGSTMESDEAPAAPPSNVTPMPTEAQKAALAKAKAAVAAAKAAKSGGAAPPEAGGLSLSVDEDKQDDTPDQDEDDDMPSMGMGKIG